MDGVLDPRPLFTKELLPLTLQQHTACAHIDEHSEAASGLDEPFIHELLIALEDGERIDAIFRRNVAHRGQWVALLEHSVQDHRHDAVAQLAVDRLIVVPLMVHQFSRYTLAEIPRA